MVYVLLDVSVTLLQPAKVAHSILLFAKGQGILTSVTLPGVERQRTFSGGSIDIDRPRRFSRGLSMEEYDKPNLRRLSITVGDMPVQVILHCFFIKETNFL